MESILTKNWNSLDRSEKIEVIESAIDNGNTSEGFLMLRYWAKEDAIGGYLRKQLDNHLCVEAVSQSTLIDLFGEDYDFQPEDAEKILNWMESQS